MTRWWDNLLFSMFHKKITDISLTFLYNLFHRLMSIYIIGKYMLCLILLLLIVFVPILLMLCCQIKYKIPITATANSTLEILEEIRKLSFKLTILRQICWRIFHSGIRKPYHEPLEFTRGLLYLTYFIVSATIYHSVWTQLNWYHKGYMETTILRWWKRGISLHRMTLKWSIERIIGNV